MGEVILKNSKAKLTKQRKISAISLCNKIQPYNKI